MSELFVHNPRPNKAYAPRRKNDFYPTPLGCARASVQWLKDNTSIQSGTALDPGFGTGVWGKAINDVYGKDTFKIQGVDIDPRFEGTDDYAKIETCDFIGWEGVDLVSGVSKARFNLIVGDPPYKHAEAFIHEAHNHVVGGYAWVIAFLLKISFLGSQSRGSGLFQTFRPNYVLIYSRRPSFSGDGHTDGSEYAFFVWDGSKLMKRGGDQQYVCDGTHIQWLDWDYAEEEQIRK